MTEGNQTTLIVDDDVAYCNALRAAFRRRGHVAVIAHDYDDAVAEAAVWTPGRAVVDLRLPRRGGLLLIQTLLDQHPAMRIVVLTGYGSIATAVTAIKMGAVNYLSKPVEIDTILRAFEDVSPTPGQIDVPVRVRPLEEIEWEHLQRVLQEAGGNVSEAARRLGMHRRTLQRKLARGHPQVHHETRSGDD